MLRIASAASEQPPASTAIRPLTQTTFHAFAFFGRPHCSKSSALRANAVFVHVPFSTVTVVTVVVVTVVLVTVVLVVVMVAGIVVAGAF